MKIIIFIKTLTFSMILYVIVAVVLLAILAHDPYVSIDPEHPWYLFYSVIDFLLHLFKFPWGFFLLSSVNDSEPSRNSIELCFLLNAITFGIGFASVVVFGFRRK